MNLENAFPRNNTREMAEHCLRVIDDLRDDLPLTVRQIYYRIVTRGLIKNEHGSYKKISVIVTKLRESGILPWNTIIDRTRYTILPQTGGATVEDYVKDHLKIPANYKIDLLKGQNNYCEIILEKDAISSLIAPICNELQTPLTVSKGHLSATFTHKIALRMFEQYRLGKKIFILYLGDFDPSGLAIPRSIETNIKEQIPTPFEFKRIAILPEQILKYKLTPNKIGNGEGRESYQAKESDANFKRWALEYGENHPTFEIDSFDIRDLKKIVREAILSYYDKDLITEQLNKQMIANSYINKVNNKLEKFISYELPEVTYE